MNTCPKCGKPAVQKSGQQVQNNLGLCAPCFKVARRQQRIDRIIRVANWIAVTGRTEKEASVRFGVKPQTIDYFVRTGLEWARRGIPPLCLIALTCAATLPIVPKPSNPRPQRTAPRLALQSPKGLSVFPLAGAVTNPPRAVTLAWNYSFTNSGVDKFKGYCWTNMIGTNFQGYKEVLWPGQVLSGRMSNLVAKATYWFSVLAGSTNGLWSDPSNIITDHPTNLVVTFTYGGASMQWAASPLGPWKATNNVVNITNATAPRLFFRGVGITNRISVTTMTY